MTGNIKSLLSPIRKTVYKLTGGKPWSYGYNDTRWELIGNSVNNNNLLTSFQNKQIPAGFGIGFDERVVEYPWLFSRLSEPKGQQLLDAGSTLNFETFVNVQAIKDRQLTIFTYYPEPVNFVPQRISYVFGDLREMALKSGHFDEIICQSTIEHIDMNNSIYGYDISKNEDERTKSYDYLKVIDELIRLLKPGGKLLLTFPYGKFEHHGFFQQFDAEMVSKILVKMNLAGKSETDYLLYSKAGWKFAAADECNNSESFNPHTGKGKGTDGAAHCRCVCCIQLIKN